MTYKLVFVCIAIFIDWSSAQKIEGDSCIDEFTQTEGHCANVEYCNSARMDFQKYRTRPTPCDFSVNSLLVCCRDPLVTTTTPPSTTPDRSNRKPGDISNKKCEQFRKALVQKAFGGALSLHPVIKEYSSERCTYRSTELIIGGVKAKLGEFPHMAAIGWDVAGTYSFQCGGTLIDKRFVLTAGHCTTLQEAANEPPKVVRLGDQNLDPNVKDGANDIQIEIREIHYHPKYKKSKKYNDIALLELEREVVFNNNIRPACLWTNKDLGNHQNAWATGWGIVNSDTMARSNELLKVSLSILDNSECNKTLEDIINRRWSHGFDETQMCAGDKRQSKDTCQGDSGSPLQIVSDESECIYKVLGITSFGAKFCGHAPAVYTRVSSYIDWIEKIVWKDE